MPIKLQSWPRSLFTPGGGDALLFYVAFGEFDLTKPFSRSKYRSDGPGEWLDIVQYDRTNNPEVFTQYQSGLLWDILTGDAPVTAATALKAPHAVALRAEVADPPTLDYFRDAVGVVTWLLDCGGTSIYDPQRFWLWSTDEWRSDVFEADEPQPLEHTVTLVSEDDNQKQWIHTRGMRQYGRPDLSVHGVGTRYMDAVTQMIERFILMQAEGGIVPDGQEIHMKNLPPGGVCRRRGNLDDPDFNNAHIEIEWKNGTLGE